MIDNLKKAYYYMQRNGIGDTVYASMERLMRNQMHYHYVPVPEETLALQRKKVYRSPVTFSILVPAYETNEGFLRELLQSVLDQSYEYWELIIADASTSDKVKNVVDGYRDYRIKYMHLEDNAGISANTNQALRVANGEYVCLLDHDDLLTADALYENASKIAEGRDNGIDYAFIYSDEDKCDETGRKYKDPNLKPEFNLDLLLSNNYICHLLTMKTDLMKSLRFRPEYDGAQDHDIVLRAYGATCEAASDMRIGYGHIARVLYHWRCHSESTAANPESKNYAYEAGQRAIEDYLKSKGIKAKVEPTKHKGFFRVEYEDNYIYPDGSSQKRIRDRVTDTRRGSIAYNLLLNRYDVGAVGGPIIKKNKITGGIIDYKGVCPFDGLDRRFSGYLHRATLQQSGMALDVRNMVLVEALAGVLVETARIQEYKYLFNQDLINKLEADAASDSIGLPYIEVSDYLTEEDHEDYEYLVASIALGRKVIYEGYINYYDPQFVDEE